MNRRNLLSALSLGVVGTATSGATLAMSEPKVKSDVKTEGPLDERMFQFRAGTKLAPPAQGDAIYMVQDKYSEYKSVNLSVGKDGNLWIKSHEGEWKRVVTE